MITVVNFNLYRFRLKKSKDSLLGTSSIYFTRFQVVSSVEQFMSVHVSDKNYVTTIIRTIHLFKPVLSQNNFLFSKIAYFIS